MDNQTLVSIVFICKHWIIVSRIFSIWYVIKNGFKTLWKNPTDYQNPTILNIGEYYFIHTILVDTSIILKKYFFFKAIVPHIIKA